MIINGKNYLLLERMGCEMMNDVPGCDVGNYRVRTQGENIPGKDGRTYFLEFRHWAKWQRRRISKRGGKTLKHPVDEIVNENALAIDTQFTTKTGSWRALALEQQIYERDFSYTMRDILNVTNEISTEHFDAIKWVEDIEIYVDPNRDFTPDSLIYQYAKEHNLQYEYNKYLTRVLSCHTGEYKYLYYEILPVFSRGQQLVRIWLERVEK